MPEQVDYQHYITVHCFNKAYLDPKFFIQCTSNETPFKEDNNPFLITLFNFIIQIFFPIFQLAAFQGFHMEIWSLYLVKEKLQSNFRNDNTEQQTEDKYAVYIMKGESQTELDY